MGMSLTELVLQETGLPDDRIRDEFQTLLDQHGLSSESLTLEDLRVVMASYLQDVFLEIKKGAG